MLIVIVVFCIGILVVLYGLSQTLRNKDYANIQIKSAFFAREWIEMMFNLRDANYHKEMPWNCVFRVKNVQSLSSEEDNPFCLGDLWKEWANVLKISMWSWNEYVHVETWSLSDKFEDNFKVYQIYMHTWNVINWELWYYYDYTWSEEEKTWFARYLVITWVMADWPIDKEKLLKIESHVLYQKWALTWEKVMETFMWNYEFKQ